MRRNAAGPRHALHGLGVELQQFRDLFGREEWFKKGNTSSQLGCVQSGPADGFIGRHETATRFLHLVNASVPIPLP